MEIKAGVHKKGDISFSELMRDIKKQDEFVEAGAIASFVGVVRGRTLKGKREVQKLEVEAYQDKADEVLEDICRDLRDKKGVVDVRIHHLLGEFEVGEDLVYVLVSGGHRKEVFDTLKQAINRFKREAPIFKKEYFKNERGEIEGHWISENKK